MRGMSGFNLIFTLPLLVMFTTPGLIISWLLYLWVPISIFLIKRKNK